MKKNNKHHFKKGKESPKGSKKRIKKEVKSWIAKSSTEEKRNTKNKNKNTQKNRKDEKISKIHSIDAYDRNQRKERHKWLFEKKKNEPTAYYDSDLSKESDRSEEEDILKKKKKQLVLFKKKDKKKKKLSGKVELSIFKNLGLSEDMCRSITTNLKYNKPTDIQKLCIPKIMYGKDIICISKTGSGKSLVYLSTLIDKLKEHSKFFGIRGLVILPSKELALQIYKLAKKICNGYFNLTIEIIVGGVSLVNQFEILKKNIDILIASPGRLSHLLTTTNLSLQKLEMLIIDEADKLFELNYYEEMNEIYKHVFKGNDSMNKQSILISATLPSEIEQYFKLKLRNPEICFINTDNVINERVDLHFIFCRSFEKYATLLKLVFLFKKKKLGKTMIFFCTKYHILFFSKLLNYLEIEHAVLYGNADTSFRFEQIQKFMNQPTLQFFLVSDLAARGINIPSVQNVINYSFPFSSKLFIHRIGRACRNNQKGYAISLVTHQDLLYAYEICFFIGKRMCFTKPTRENEGTDLKERGEDIVTIGSIGSLSEYVTYIEEMKSNDGELLSLYKSICASYKLYYSMRPKVSKFTSSECIKKVQGVGGLYQINRYIFPSDLYKNEEELFEVKKKKDATDIKEPKEEKTHKKGMVQELQNMFNGILQLLQRKKKNENQSEKKTDNEENMDKNNDPIIEQKDETHSVNENADKVNSYNVEEEANTNWELSLHNKSTYSQDEIISFLHNFQNNNNKQMGISEEVKEKLNQLKEKNMKNKERKKKISTWEEENPFDDFLEEMMYQLSDEESPENMEDFEHMKKEWDDREETSESKNTNTKEASKYKKKISKRAMKKITKKKNSGQEATIEKHDSKKEELSFEDILQKINNKRIEKEKKQFDMKTPGFDLAADEEEEMNKQRFIKKKIWNTKKKKFILTEIDTFHNKEITDGSEKKTKTDTKTIKLYEKWMKQTKSRIKNPGELEERENKHTLHRRNNKQIGLKMKEQEINDKEKHIKALNSVHPEISEAISKHIPLTQKQKRLYKKYMSGKYLADKESTIKTEKELAKEKKKEFMKKLRTNKKFKEKYRKNRTKKYQKKMQEKQNKSSQKTRSVMIIRNKKIRK